MVDGFAERVLPLLEVEDRREAFFMALREPTEPAEFATLEGLLSYPLPFPAGLIAESLGRFDRSLRYAMRAVETGEPVIDLYERRARLPGIANGLVIEYVLAGSIHLNGVSSEDLYRFLQSKPVVITLAVFAALDLLGLEPRIEFGDRAAPQPPTVIAPRTVVRPEFKITINVDGQSVPITCDPQITNSPPWHQDQPGRP